jgi:hypothetical protein
MPSSEGNCPWNRLPAIDDDEDDTINQIQEEYVPSFRISKTKRPAETYTRKGLSDSRDFPIRTVRVQTFVHKTL